MEVERAKRFIRSSPPECQKTHFWNVGKTLRSSKIIPEVIIQLYIVYLLYLGYLPLATGRCESCQHIIEKRGHALGEGANTAFLLQLEGKQRNWVGN